MSICQRDRWLAMIARSGDEVVLAPLGEAARNDEQVDLICDTVLHAFSRGEAAAISGFNVPSATFESTLKANAPKGRAMYSRQRWPASVCLPTRSRCCRPHVSSTNRRWGSLR